MPLTEKVSDVGRITTDGTEGTIGAANPTVWHTTVTLPVSQSSPFPFDPQAARCVRRSADRSPGSLIRITGNLLFGQDSI